LTFRLAVAVTLAGIALSGCGGEEEETGAAVELGTDVRLPELDPTALEPPPRFTKAEEEALSQLLQGNLDRVTEGDVRSCSESSTRSPRAHRPGASESWRTAGHTRTPGYPRSLLATVTSAYAPTRR
jgi:hypothetical protein